MHQQSLMKQTVTTSVGMAFNSTSAKNPRCFFDLSIDGADAGRLVFQLHADVVPKTAANFLELCKNESGQGYKGSGFHRIIDRFMAQGGDFTNHNGTGGRSIYGPRFADENFSLTHTKAGQLSMANAGPDTNGSQFFITFVPCPWLDGKHVVFGEVVEGAQLLDTLEQAGSSRGVPSKRIIIKDCGQLE